MLYNQNVIEEVAFTFEISNFTSQIIIVRICSEKPLLHILWIMAGNYYQIGHTPTACVTRFVQSWIYLVACVSSWFEDKIFSTRTIKSY
jgi:hypothetical protein